MFHTLQTFYRTITRQRFRVRACLTVACWLLLNMQLALAAHHSSPGYPADDQPVHSHASHHYAMPAVDNVAQKILCEKHCYPDNAQPPSSADLQLNALPTTTSLALIPATHSVRTQQETWWTPPVTGPPAEIRFCRFRE